MSQPNNGQAISLPQIKQHLPNGHQARYTAETVLRTRPKTYRKAVQLLADPNWSALQISKSLRLSEHTVRAIRTREAQDIAERKKSLVAMLANVAELGAGRKCFSVSPEIEHQSFERQKPTRNRSGVSYKTPVPRQAIRGHRL